MLKGWVSKYRDRYRGHFQAFPWIVAMFIVPIRVHENPNIALNITRTSERCLRYVPLECNVTTCKCKQLKDLLIKGCGSHFHHESSSLNVRDKDMQLKWLPHPLIG